MVVGGAEVGEFFDARSVFLGFSELHDVVVVFVIHGKDEVEVLEV